MTGPQHGATAGEPAPDGDGDVAHPSTPAPVLPGAQARPGPETAVIEQPPSRAVPAPVPAALGPATVPGPPGHAAVPAQPATAATTTGAQARATAAQPIARSAHAAAEARGIPDAARDDPGDDGRRTPNGSPPNGSPPDGNGPRGLAGRLAQLSIGSHTTTRSALAQLGVTSPGSGLLLGADRRRQPVHVRFFRPEPTRVTLVGGVQAGKLIVFRALALGARVTVVTIEPHVWDGFGERATGQRDRIGVLTIDRPLALTATAQRPALLVYDLGTVGASVPPRLGRWQTQFTILRKLDQSGISAVQECHLVTLQRLDGGGAALVGGVLRLSGHTVQFLQSMADDMVALIDGGADEYVWLGQTDMERRYAGVAAPPRDAAGSRSGSPRRRRPGHLDEPGAVTPGEQPSSPGRQDLRPHGAEQRALLPWAGHHDAG